MESSTLKKTVAILGAGPGGLSSAKECLDSNLIPTIFEKAQDIGGLWNPQYGGTWKGMLTNLSKFSNNFSDFPLPNSTSDFTTQQNIYEYLQSYAKHFSLYSYLKLNTLVTKVKRIQDRWAVYYKHNNEEKTEEFDFVIVATGIFSKKCWPAFVQNHTFEGTLIHSMDYKSANDIKGNNVIVIGGSFSGSEIASDLCRAGKQVTNIIRSPSWYIPRYIEDRSLKGTPKMPLDLVFYKKSKAPKPSDDISQEDINRMRNTYLSNFSNQHEVHTDLKIEDYTKPPKVSIANGYLEGISAGKIVIKKGATSIDKTGVLLQDGSHVAADAIIVATGYFLDLPFFEQDVLDTLDFVPNDQIQPILLYKCTFHPDLNNIAFVGVYKGPYFGIIELQARWTAAIFSQNKQLPTREVMLKGLEGEKAIRMANPRPQFPHGNYREFASSLAEEISVNPAIEEIEQSDPDLFQKLENYALIPAHFRLQGDHKKVKIAREQIDELVKFTNNSIKEAETNVE